MKSVGAISEGVPATVAADGRRVVAPALRPAPGAAGSPGAGVKATTGPEAPLEGQERSRPLLPCGARVLKGSCPLGSGLGSGRCDTMGPASAQNSQPVSQHMLEPHGTCRRPWVASGCPRMDWAMLPCNFKYL